MARVMTAGAKKHGTRNWLEHVHPELSDIYLDKVMRHLSATQRGEVVDPDDGELHTVHALCDLMVIAAHQIRGTLDREIEPESDPFDPDEGAWDRNGGVA